MISVLFELPILPAVNVARYFSIIGESKQFRPDTFNTMWRFCYQLKLPPRHKSNSAKTPATIMFTESKKSNRHLSPDINQHGQWLASKTATTKRSIVIISIDKIVQIRIKNSFFCDLPIYRKPLDNVVCLSRRRYILLLGTNYSLQVSEK